MWDDILTDKKKIYSLFGIIALVISLVIAMFYVLYQKNQKDIVIEHTEKFEEISKVIELEKANTLDKGQMIEFIRSHVPYQDDHTEILAEYVLDEVYHETEYAKDGVDGSDQITLFFAELYYAITTNEVDALLGLFNVYGYMDYLNEFETLEEKDKALLDVVNFLNKEGTLTGMSYYTIAKFNTYNVLLVYEDGYKMTVQIEVKADKVNAHSNAEGIYYITSPITNLLNPL